MSPRLRPVELPAPPPTAPRADTRRLLRIEDVADRLQVSRSMVWRLVRDGSIRSIRIGRAVRFRASDIDLFINVNEP